MLKVAIMISVMEGDDGLPGCLEECQRQVDSISSSGKYSFSIYLNENGGKGRQTVFEKASLESPDLYLWIDHDLRLSEKAFECLLENSEFLRHRTVVAGTVSGKEEGLLFGGRTKRGRLIEPDPVIPIPCQTFDLDLALMPAAAFSQLPNHTAFFHPVLPENGYGKRLSKFGTPRMLAPGVLASTSRIPHQLSWKDPDLNIKEKLSRLVLSLFK